jgi:hypothetical protein
MEDKAVVKTNDGTDPLKIELCFVVEISESDFWMDANGGYTSGKVENVVWLLASTTGTTETGNV